MALKITIASAKDAAEFLDLMISAHDVLNRRLEFMSQQQNKYLHEELERREYRINREKQIAENEKSLKIVGE